MSLEVRFIDENGEERRSSPARDVAFFWPQLVQLAGDGLVQGHIEPWLRDYLDQHGVDESQLAATLYCYTRFCELAVHPDYDHPRKALAASGFFDCPPAAQLAVCAKLGQIVTGAFWAGIRSSNPEAHMPASIQSLRSYAQSLIEELSRGHQRCSWWSRLRGWLTGGSPCDQGRQSENARIH